MSGTCQGCGHVSDDRPEDSPPNPSHCGHCPPWICDGCHETCSMSKPCACWTSLEGMSHADIKALFAASDLSLSPPNKGKT